MTFKFLQEREMGMRKKKKTEDYEEAGLIRSPISFPRKRKSRNEDSESGRSMVEMLGTVVGIVI